MNMNFIYTILISLCILGSWQTINAQTWSKKENAPFPGKPREGAVSFVLDNKAYIATGYTITKRGDLNDYQCAKDMWQYDPQTEIWTQMPDFPGKERTEAVAFVANGKAYIGLGVNNAYFNDFYEYTPPPVNRWMQIADFPGSARASATAFSINNVGYVGTGRDTDNTALSDFYKYENQQWGQISSIGNGYAHKSYATSFVVNGHGYIFGGGRSSAPQPFNFNRQNEKWSQESSHASFEDLSSYVLNDVPYLFDGYDLLTYNFSSKQTTKISSPFNNLKRIDRPCFFVLNGIPYKTTGEEIGEIGHDNSLWYDASVSSVKTTDIQLPGILSTIVEDKLIFSLEEQVGIFKIFNMTGILVLQQIVKQGENTININLPDNRLYIFSVETGHGNYFGKIFKK